MMKNEKKEFLNIGLVIGTLFVLLGTSIISAAMTQHLQNTPTICRLSQTWIVDNEGDGDFTTIEAAYENASDGDTIEVYSGTYNVTSTIPAHGMRSINKSLVIAGISHELGSGTDTGKPILTGVVLRIEKNFTTITGFCFKKVLYVGGYCVGDPRPNNITISHNIFEAEDGIILCVRGQALIVRNHFNCSIQALLLWSPNKNINVTENNFIDDFWLLQKYQDIFFEIFQPYIRSRLRAWTELSSVFTSNYYTRHHTALPKMLFGYFNTLHQNTFRMILLDRTPVTEPYTI
jgi:hypothetical protein